MNELSLFTGTGGGILGTMLLGWKAIGYVEWNKYCCRVLQQRIKDGILEDAPIYCGDIREFILGGFAEGYRGVADVITAGFPCQPFTTSGKRLGESDPRNQWPATREVIEIVRPGFLLLENVPGLIGTEYFAQVIGEISELGYLPRWTVLGADDAGAPHRRKRVWIVADTDQSRGTAGIPATSGGQARIANQPDDAGEEHTWPSGPLEPLRLGEPLRLIGTSAGRCDCCGDLLCLAHHMHLADCGCSTDEIHCKDCDEWTLSPDTGVCEWCGSSNTDQPGMDGDANGSSNRMDRFEAIGNGQVPAVVKLAWETLIQRI